MEKSNQFEASSSLATIKEIQKRLARPSSLHSQSSSSFLISSHRKLEDYLHPVLLSAIRAKIGGKRKIVGESMEVTKKKNEAEEFDRFEEWSNFTGGLRVEDKKMERNDVVDLNCDTDSILVGGGGGGGCGAEDGSDEEEEQVECSPFRRFEKTALKRFKGR